MKRSNLTDQGKTILRPQQRRGGNRLFWVVAHYTGGWSNWSETLHYATQAEAFSVIEHACKQNENLIDDRIFD